MMAKVCVRVNLSGRRMGDWSNNSFFLPSTVLLVCLFDYLTLLSLHSPSRVLTLPSYPHNLTLMLLSVSVLLFFPKENYF
jgi:hypothetical protein